MRDDLVSRLRDAHANSTQRIFGSNIFNEAALALTEARAEIVSLRAELGETQLVLEQTEKNAAREIERWAAQALKEECCREVWSRKALAAESELSTLRARVREVVGPFAKAAADLDDTDKDSTDIWEAPCAMQINVGHLSAARQLMEEVK